MNKLSRAQVKALDLTSKRLLVVVWEAGTIYGNQGVKPWYAETGGVQEATLRRLWLDEYIRSVSPRELYAARMYTGGRAIFVGRARLTKKGRVALAQARSDEWVDAV